MCRILMLAAVLFPMSSLAADARAPDIEAPEPLGFFAAPFDLVTSVRFLPVVEIDLEVERAWKAGSDWRARSTRRCAPSVRSAVRGAARPRAEPRLRPIGRSGVNR